MATMERDIINQGRDENGNLTIDYPLTRLGWMESSADVKSAPGANDCIPIVDSADSEKMKKTPVAALKAQAAPMLYDYSGADELTDLAEVDISNSSSPFNQTKLFQGARKNFVNVPPGLGEADDTEIIGLREVLFVCPKRLMVKVTEFHPNPGRVYYNHYNWTDWTGWYSPDVAISTVSNPNLLDNWYFADPINQRRQTEYAGEIYGIDRWKGTWTGDGVLTLVNPGTADGCISLFRNGYPAHTTQIIRNSQALAGRTVTFSALVKNDPGGNCAIIVRGQTSPEGNYIDFASNSSSSETYTRLSVTAVIPADTVNLMVVITSSNSAKSYIKAAKLELGDRQTLARQIVDGSWVLNDPPPDKTLELLKCQLYYQRHGCGLTCLVHSANEVLFTFPFPIAMRTTPVVGFLSQTISLYDPAHSGAAVVTLSDANITVPNVTNTGSSALVIQGTFQGETAFMPGDVLRIKENNDLFEFSSEP